MIKRIFSVFISLAIIISSFCFSVAAEDCSHDRAIDCADVVLLERAGILLACVNQCKSQEEQQNNSVYVHYLSLVEQRSDEIITENDGDSVPKICKLIDKIIAFLIT